MRAARSPGLPSQAGSPERRHSPTPANRGVSELVGPERFARGEIDEPEYTSRLAALRDRQQSTERRVTRPGNARFPVHPPRPSFRSRRCSSAHDRVVRVLLLPDRDDHPPERHE